MHTYTESPVFIVGAMRSGTTLLRLMMDHHPEICIFDEFEYAVRWIQDGKFPTIDEYRERLELDRVFNLHQFEIDTDLGYEQLVRSFLDQAVASKQKRIPGATVHSSFQFLPQIWKDARFIHLVRDPRDVARSSKVMNWVGNVWFGSEMWIEPIKRWKQLCEVVPENQRMEVRFEELIANYEGELTRICEFLGLEYSPEMLSYAENSTYSVPDIGLTKQWKRKMTKQEVGWVEYRCQALMEEFGYEKSSEDLRPPSSLQLLSMKMQNRMTRLKASIKRFGLPRWCMWQFAKRLPYCQLKRNILSKFDNFVTQTIK